eukprot:3767553-Rhodomonas_salina.2
MSRDAGPDHVSTGTTRSGGLGLGRGGCTGGERVLHWQSGSSSQSRHWQRLRERLSDRAEDVQES